MSHLTRRSFLASTAAIAGASVLPRIARAQVALPDQPLWLLFTKSSGFEHDVVKEINEQPSYLAQQLGPLFNARKLTIMSSKNGKHFEPEKIGKFAGFVFYTTGDLTTEGTDKQPPMSAAGKQAFLDAISAGVPFIGLHCASDTFHAPAGAEADPYTKMLGGEFDAHGNQQKATAQIVDDQFPGIGAQADWSFTEEWYALKNIAKDIHPIQELQTAGMEGDMYKREPFPNTWTRHHGKGRVFYTAIGHREDVIASKAYLSLIGGAIDWCLGAK